MSRRALKQLGIVPNLVAAIVLLVLFDTGLHGWTLWFAAASIVLLTELILLALALELRRRKRRGSG